MRRNPRGGRGNYDSGRDRGRGRGGGGRKREELDPMDPSSYSDVPRYVIKEAINGYLSQLMWFWYLLHCQTFKAWVKALLLTYTKYRGQSSH